MKAGILSRRPVPMGDTEIHIVIRFGLTSAVVTKYLDTMRGSKSAKWGFVAI